MTALDHLNIADSYLRQLKSPDLELIPNTPNFFDILRKRHEIEELVDEEMRLALKCLRKRV